MANSSVSLCSRRGSIFIYAISVVFILSVMTFSIGTIALSRIDLAGRLDSRKRLKYIAESGIYTSIACIKSEFAENPSFLFSRVMDAGFLSGKYLILSGKGAGGAQKKSDTVLPIGYNYSIDINRGSVYCAIRDEDSRINLNGADKEALRRLFSVGGGAEDEAALQLACAVIDWRDTDDKLSSDGVQDREGLFYGPSGSALGCKNAPFELKEELLLVKGVTSEMFERIKPYITVYGSGKVNINTCSPEVMRVLGLSDSLTDKVLSFRKTSILSAGIDRILFKSDGKIVEELGSVLFLTDNEAAELDELIGRNQIGVDSGCFDLSCLGVYAGKYLLASCVVEKNGDIRYFRLRYVDKDELIKGLKDA